jgi:hypothetical protein
VTMRDPQQVSDQLDNLVRDVEQTEETVQQVEAIFGTMGSDLEGLMSVEGSPADSGAARRTRMTN